MTTQPITIENGLVTIRPTAYGVWLTQSQIADLFGVFTTAVNANIRAILKSGVLLEDCAVHRTRSRNGNIVERYNLEMITALAFRLKSENAEVFRRWIVERAMTTAIVWKMPTSKDFIYDLISVRLTIPYLLHTATTSAMQPAIA